MANTQRNDSLVIIHEPDAAKEAQKQIETVLNGQLAATSSHKLTRKEAEEKYGELAFLFGFGGRRKST